MSTQTQIDNLKKALKPFTDLVEAVPALELLASKEQAIQELDGLIGEKQQALTEAADMLDRVKQNTASQAENANQAANEVLKEAKAKATSIVDSAQRKTSALENKALDAVRQSEDSVVELEARAAQAKEQETSAQAKVVEAEVKYAKIMEAIAKLSQG
jgi:cell division septum initiation protein DivIVA